jgi:thymidine phosphorylase
VRVLIPADIIRDKRNGVELNAAKIETLVQGIVEGSVGEAQVGAFLMAVYLRGMTAQEQVALTLAMRDSGTCLEWSDLDGPVLDKHSTGGVGDLVSLVLAPMVAACGGFVPMISGRSLGHTGGTLDKLESIPGFNVNLGLDRLRQVVHEAGFGMVGQGVNLAPADKQMYAVRDVTATVSSIPLIVSSILSKKLAEGLDGLVMDIKTGNGAFMTGKGEAVRLAMEICMVAEAAGLKASALVTNMDQPLARAAGNSLEMHKAIAYLRGEAINPRLEEVTMALGAEMLAHGGIEPDTDRARALLGERVASGAAAERFARMVYLQGGPADLLEKPGQYLEAAPLIRPCIATRSGWVTRMDTRGIGHCVVQLGGGRGKVGDTIDHRVGLAQMCEIGQRIEAGDPLAAIHAASEEDWQQAAVDLADCIELGEEPVKPGSAVINHIQP